ncbi:FAD-dependent oxidoreductase [Undibacterium arcticum]
MSLPHADAREWVEQCDLLVLGFGAAGACAALEAASRGADVLLCERFDGGGASAKKVAAWCMPAVALRSSARREWRIRRKRCSTICARRRVMSSARAICVHFATAVRT